MSTEEGNRLIAEFMGYEYHSDRNLFIYIKDDLQFNGHSKEWPLYGLAYDTSWDWLRPVIDKIWENTKNGNYPKETNREYSFLQLQIYAPLNEVWIAVVEFIKWYNQNKTL